MIMKGWFTLLILSEENIRTLYSMEDCLKDIEQAFLLFAEGKVENPVRTALSHPNFNGTTLYMPSYIQSLGSAAIKIVSVFPNNSNLGKKTIQGVILLTDDSTGEHLALLEASYLTVLRTGAVTGVATKYLARKSAQTLAVLGCGAQSIGQIQAIFAVRDISRLILYNRTKEKINYLLQKFKNLYPNWSGEIIIANTANNAIKDADIIVCSTRSTTPLFDGNLLRHGTHINGIGSYQPHMQEVDLVTLVRSNKVVVDTIEGAKHEAGDFLIPIQQENWSFDRLYGELCEIVAGKKEGRETEQEITFFKSVGTAFLDAAVSHSVFQKAKEKGVGINIAL
jgi:ornithine cyclodeaminase/alanine dehydrogenase-like protein (mu-crystallin family)